MADDGKTGAKEKRPKSKGEPAKVKGGASKGKEAGKAQDAAKVQGAAKAQDAGKAEREARRAANQAEREARRAANKAERKSGASAADSAEASAGGKPQDGKQGKDKPARNRPEKDDNKAKRLAAKEANIAARAEKREQWLAKQAAKAAAAQAAPAGRDEGKEQGDKRQGGKVPVDKGPADKGPEDGAAKRPAFKEPPRVAAQAPVSPFPSGARRGAPEMPSQPDPAATAPAATVPPVSSPVSPVVAPQAAGGQGAQEQAFLVLNSPRSATSQVFNILIVAQAGRLAREAVLFAASLRRNAPEFRGRLIVAEPQPEGAWAGVQTRIPAAERALLTQYGAEILPFTARHFGRSYPYGNKIEALALLPAREPFVFFDSDTLVLGPLDRVPFDFARPSASMRREGTWPEPPLYGPGYAEIWRSLYDRFQLDFDSSQDKTRDEDDWQRYLYFNAGWFFGADPEMFGKRFLDAALKIGSDPGEALACQSLDPWLDQAVLPLVVHSLQGGRPGPELAGLDGDVTCHYRNLSLLYARESDAAVAEMEALLADPAIAALFVQDKAVQQVVAAGQGRARIRPLFAAGLPPSEKVVRQLLKRESLWFNH